MERTHYWFNRFRYTLTRWCKKERNYLGMLYFVCGLVTYRATTQPLARHLPLCLAENTLPVRSPHFSQSGS